MLHTAKFANLGVLDRKFRGKERLSEPRIREFREFGTANLRGITVVILFNPVVNFAIPI